MQRSVSSQPSGRRPDSPERGCEAAGARQRSAAEGHVAADQVAHRRGVLGQPPVAAAHDPVELLGDPPRPPLLPRRGHGAADRDHARIGIGRPQPARPSPARRRRRRRGRRRRRRAPRPDRCCARRTGPAPRRSRAASRPRAARAPSGPAPGRDRSPRSPPPAGTPAPAANRRPPRARPRAPVRTRRSPRTPTAQTSRKPMACFTIPRASDCDRAIGMRSKRNSA